MVFLTFLHDVKKDVTVLKHLFGTMDEYDDMQYSKAIRTLYDNQKKMMK